MPAGRPPEYNPDFHPADCERLGKLGKFKVQMARDWDVDCSTIDNWCAQYPQFLLSYTRAKSYRAAWMMDQTQEGLITDKGTTFNAQAMGMMLKYDGNQLDERFIKMPKLADAQTFAEQSKVVLGAFAAGEITAKEANQIADIISKSAKVEETTELRRMLEAIEVARKQGR